MERPALSFTSTNVPETCLNLVEADPEDQDVMLINSRMGMSVPDFMGALGYSTTSSHVKEWDSVVWPKHTDLEVVDPWAVVYRYEPSDISWCIRFKALGCYNIFPGRQSERPSLIQAPSNPVPCLPLPFRDFSDAQNRNDASSIDNLRGQKILKLGAPSENITPAERHKLWEDLRLSDSDEENESKAKISPKGNIKSPDKFSIRSEDSTAKQDNSSVSTKLGKSIHAIRPPPPFVSPLFVTESDFSDPKSLQSAPQTHEKQSENHSSKDGFNAVVPSSVSVLSDKIDTGTSKSFGTTNENIKSTVSCPVPVSLSNSDSSIQKYTVKKTIQSVNTPASSCSNIVSIGSNDRIKQQIQSIQESHKDIDKSIKNPEINKVFIDRLLMESEEILAVKKECQVPGLSSFYENYSTDEENNSSPIVSVNLQRSSTLSIDNNNNASSVKNNDNNLLNEPIVNHELDKSSDEYIHTTINSTKQCKTMKKSDAKLSKDTEIFDVSKKDKTKELKLSSISTTTIVTTTVSTSTPLITTDTTTVTTSNAITSTMITITSTTSTGNVLDNGHNLKMRTLESPVKSTICSSAYPVTSPKLSLIGRDSSTHTSSPNNTVHLNINSNLSSDMIDIQQNSNLLNKQSRSGEIRSDNSNVQQLSEDCNSLIMPPPAPDSTTKRLKRSRASIKVSDPKSVDVEHGTSSSDQDSTKPVCSLLTSKSDECRLLITPCTDVNTSSNTINVTAVSNNNVGFNTTVTNITIPAVNTSTISTVTCDGTPTDNLDDDSNIYPLRDIPSDCWLFSDLALTKVRTKLQQTFNRLSSSTPPEGKASLDLVKKMRELLKQIAVENQSPLSNNTQSRRNRPRSLTGVLLVPPQYSFVESIQKEENNPTKQIIEQQQLKLQHNMETMTSPFESIPAVVTCDADIQCDLFSTDYPPFGQTSQSSNSEGLIDIPTSKSLKTGSHLSSNTVTRSNSLGLSTFNHILPSSVSSSTSPRVNMLLESLNFLEEQYEKVTREEEQNLQNSNTLNELYQAEECKIGASHCWKSLVSAISAYSRGNVGENGTTTDRSQLLLTLNALHQYPVQMVKSVQHYISAAHLFEIQTDLSRAVDVLNDAIDQVQQCIRRMRRVEAKLIKRRGRQTESDHNHSPNLKGLTSKAKRDAGWMHLWYYGLMRIKAVIGFQIYRLRFKSIESLRKEVEMDLITHQIIPNLKMDVLQNDLFSSMRSPSINKHNSDDKNDSLNHQSNKSFEDPKKLLESIVDRFVRLDQMTINMHRAMLDWQQADELISKVPYLKGIPNKLTTSTVSATSDDPSNVIPKLPVTEAESTNTNYWTKKSVDSNIAYASDGVYLRGSQIPLVVVVRYINGLINVHSTLVYELKNDCKPETNSSISDSHFNSQSHVNSPVQTNVNMEIEAANPQTNISTIDQTDILTPDKFQRSSIKRHKSKISKQSDTIDSENDKPVQNKSRKKDNTEPFIKSTTSSIDISDSQIRKKGDDMTPSLHSMNNNNNAHDQSKDQSESDAIGRLESFDRISKHKSKRRRLIQPDNILSGLETSSIVDVSSTTNTDNELESNLAPTTSHPDQVIDPKKFRESPMDRISKRINLNHKVTAQTHQRSLNSDVDQVLENSDVSGKKIQHEISSKVVSSPKVLNPNEKTHKFTKKSHKPSGTETNTSQDNPISPVNSHSLSPSPSRNIYRSKSLVPDSNSRNLNLQTNNSNKLPVERRKKHIDIDLDRGDENAYKPKRIRSASSKSRKHLSDSESSVSDSSPPPTYRPSSVFVNSPNHSKEQENTKKRKIINDPIVTDNDHNKINNNNDIIDNNNHNDSDEEKKWIKRRHMRSRSVNPSASKGDTNSSLKFRNQNSIAITNKDKDDNITNDYENSLVDEYSPTKCSGLFNGNRSESANIKMDKLPVYHVSRIESSPDKSHHHHNYKKSKSKFGSNEDCKSMPYSSVSSSSSSNSVRNTLSTSVCSGIVNKSPQVPSFYSRWIKGPVQSDQYIDKKHRSNW